MKHFILSLTLIALSSLYLKAQTECDTNYQVTISANKNDQMVPDPDTVELCKGESVKLVAMTNTGNMDSLFWTSTDELFEGAQGPVLDLKPVESFFYFLAFREGGCEVFDTIYVRVDSLPDLTIMPSVEKNPYCQGDTLSLISPTYDPSAYEDIEHRWIEGIGFETPDSLFNMVVTAQDTSLYRRATQVHACVDTADFLMNVVKPEIQVSPMDTFICPGDKVKIVATFPDKPKGELTWEPEFPCKNCKEQTVQPATSMTYTAKLDVEGCPASATANVTVLPLPSLLLNPNNTICQGDNISLNLNPSPSTTYSWTSTDDPTFSSTSANPVVSPTKNTTYMVTAKVLNCPEVKNNIQIIVILPPTLTISGDGSICLDDVANLSAQVSANQSLFNRFVWTATGITNPVVGQNAAISGLRTNATVQVTYSYGVSEANLCGTLTATKQVEVKLPVQLERIAIAPSQYDSMPQTALIPQGTPLQLTLITIPANPQGASYEWKYDGVKLGDNSAKLSDTPTQNGAYEATVTAANGCTSSITRQIELIPPQYWLPKAFTPNDDTNNDFFNIVALGNIVVKDFQVFNRWGQKVYNNDDNNQGWDGKQNGSPAPSDVYVYVIVLELPDGREAVEKGDVTLIR